MEKFVKVVGFSRYEVSSFGYVRDMKKERVVKHNPNEKGYMKLNLNGDDGKRHTRKLHRLVCEHFVANPGDKPQIDHIDENKANNRADNLKWCTNQENIDFFYENNPDRKAVPKSRVYGSREEMIKAVGNPVCVNGVEFYSSGLAADYILSFEPTKKKATVSKTIRKMVSGKRAFGTMYGRFIISGV